MHESWSQFLVWILIPPLICCVILSNLIIASKGQFPYQQNSDNVIQIVIKVNMVQSMK